MSTETKASVSLQALLRPSISYCIPLFVIIVCSSFSDQLKFDSVVLTYSFCFATGATLAAMFICTLQVLDHFLCLRWELYKTMFTAHKTVGAFILPIGVIGLFPNYFENLQLSMPVFTSYSLIALAFMLLRWNKLYQ